MVSDLLHKMELKASFSEFQFETNGLNSICYSQLSSIDGDTVAYLY